MRLAVLFRRIGPYHKVRLEAAGRLGDLWCIEGTGADRTYAWNAVATGRQFQRLTLFPTADSDRMPRREVHRAAAIALDESRPTVVAVPGWQDPLALAAVAWAVRSGCPIILMSDSSESDYKRVWWKEYIKHRIVGCCSAALVAAQPQAAYVAKLGMPSERVFFGYDVVDNDYFAAGADSTRGDAIVLRRSLSLERSFVLSVARFIPEKNLLSAVRAYSSYVEQVGEAAWDWVLCGDGPLKQEIVYLCRQLGVESRVRMPGFIQYDELPTYYGLAELFWQPSVKDCFPLAVNEAMAAGLPVAISRRCGNASTFITEGYNGWTFDPLSEREMTGVLLSAHGLPGPQRKVMGRRSREIIADWGPRRFAQGLEAAVRKAMEVGPPRVTMVDRMLLGNMARC